MVKGCRALLQQRQIVERVDNVLFALVAARMRGEDALVVENFDHKRVRFEREVAGRLVDGDGIAIGFKDDLAIRRERGDPLDTAGQVVGGHGAEQGLLVAPGHPNGRRLAIHAAGVVLVAALEQLGIQVVKGLDLAEGHHEITAGKANAMLHAAFLVPLADRAKETVKQIMAAEDHKGILLGTAVARQDFFDRRGQIVVAEAVGHALEVVKGVDMAVEKGFLFLGGIGADEELARIAQAHDKDLDGLLDALHDHSGLAPIDLGVGTGVKLQGQEQFGFVLVAPELGQKGTDIGFGAAIALGRGPSG